MDVLGFLVVRFILFILPFIALKSLDTKLELELWWIWMPIMCSILVSVFLPRKIKWIFRYLVPVIISIFLCRNVYIETFESIKESSKYKEMIHDCLIFINVASFMKVFQDELLSITSVVIYLLYKWIRKFGLHSVLLYIVLCMANAVILVFLSDYFVLIVQNRMHNFYYLKPSTISVQLEVDLRNSDYILPELQSYEKHHSYKILSNGVLTYEGSYAKINTIRAPLCRKVYHRVPGEDVKISCDSKIWKTQLLDYRNIEFIDEYRSYYWEQNLKPIHDFYKESYRKDKTFYLQIRPVRPEDFSTEFSLWVETDVIYLGKILTLKVKIGYFFLQLQKDIEHYIHIPNGFVLNIYNLKFYAQSTHDDLVVSYNVSSIMSRTISGDTSALCDKKFDGCSPFVKYLYKNFYLSVFEKRKLNSVRLSSSRNKYYYANSLSCVCNFVYGKHNFCVHKYTFIKNLNRTVLTEIELPYSFVVLPIGLTNYTRQKYDNLRNDVLGRISRREDWRYSLQFFIDDKKSFYYYMHYLENAAIFIFVSDVCMIFVLLVKLYNYIFVRQLARCFLIQNPQHALPDTCPCNIGNLSNNEDMKYDIMIIYNEAEYVLVKNLFVPFFENYSKAVQSCRNYVIIGSEKFVNDQWNNEFILGDLILQMIHERQGHHVIVVKWNNAEVPRAFRWDPKITIIEWSGRRSTSENMAIFKNKVQSILCVGRMFC